MNIYLDKLFIDISEKEFNYMFNNNIIEYNKESKRYHIVEDSEFSFLFKIKSKNKVYFYLSQMVKQDFICQNCGQPHAYNMIPNITKSGEVEFNKVICVCKKCRFEELKKRNMLKPIYKQKINWKKVQMKINEDIKKYKIREEDKKYYRSLCCNIVILEKYTNLILPKIKTYEEISNKPIDLSNLNIKKDFKLNLYMKNRKCSICGKKVSYENFTIDHIIAKKIGGQDTEDNLMGMCIKCNKEKGHKTIIEFLSSKELCYFDSKLLIQAKIQQEKSKIKLEKLKKIKIELENKNIK